jgi:predicted TIM-barrel fold metal-dependent hydrolase
VTHLRASVDTGSANFASSCCCTYGYSGYSASRRAFLKSVVVLGGGAVLSTSGTAAAAFAQATSSAPTSKGNRIDVHGHFSPPNLFKAMLAQGRQNFADWTPQQALEAMDESGVATAMTSVPPHFDLETVDQDARPANEFAARFLADHRGRFGVFAFLPMPHVDTTLREIEYAFDTLKLDGVGMFTNYADKWLGDAMFNPVFEELNRRNAIVFVHPISLGPSQFAQLLSSDGAIQEQTDTTRALANMIFGGAASRYPNVRMIFAHGGGTMPYLIERFTSMAKGQRYAQLLPQGFSGAASRFYYDTAWTSNPVAMGALTKVVPLSQIMFGTDYPARTIADHVKGLKECGVFTDRQLEQIERENALALFPRFKT